MRVRVVVVFINFMFSMVRRKDHELITQFQISTYKLRSCNLLSCFFYLKTHVCIVVLCPHIHSTPVVKEAFYACALQLSLGRLTEPVQKEPYHWHSARTASHFSVL